MNKIEEGIAANDTAIAAVKNGYLPLSGGTVSGAMTISGGIATQKITTDALSITDASGKISVTGSQLNFGQNNGTVTSTITGISDNKGASSTIAVSQKCLKNNYLPLAGGGTISGGHISIRDYGELAVSFNEGDNDLGYVLISPNTGGLEIVDI